MGITTRGESQRMMADPTSSVTNHGGDFHMRYESTSRRIIVIKWPGLKKLTQGIKGFFKSKTN
jgi:hypothetical protein